jgi:hypothetical protein
MNRVGKNCTCVFIYFQVIVWHFDVCIYDVRKKTVCDIWYIVYSTVLWHNYCYFDPVGLGLVKTKLCGRHISYWCWTGLKALQGLCGKGKLYLLLKCGNVRVLTKHLWNLGCGMSETVYIYKKSSNITLAKPCKQCTLVFSLPRLWWNELWLLCCAQLV